MTARTQLRAQHLAICTLVVPSSHGTAELKPSWQMGYKADPSPTQHNAAPLSAAVKSFPIESRPILSRPVVKHLINQSCSSSSANPCPCLDCLMQKSWQPSPPQSSSWP